MSGREGREGADGVVEPGGNRLGDGEIKGRGGRQCKSGVERKRRQLAEAEIRESTEMAFDSYGEQLESVPRFTYLGRVMTAGDEDWPAVAGT